MSVLLMLQHLLIFLLAYLQNRPKNTGKTFQVCSVAVGLMYFMLSFFGMQTFGLRFYFHCRSFASNLKQVANKLLTYCVLRPT